MTDFNEARWIEAWMDTYIHYALLLLYFKDDTLKIYDPQDQKFVNETFPNYDEACSWLWEDEYHKIETRYVFEEDEILTSIEPFIRDKSKLTETQWVEVWIEFVYNPNIFLLYGFKDGSLKIFNPKDKGHERATFSSYAEAYDWLSEDEYDHIRTRLYLIDDPE
ncbi:MAG: hypothetical protein K8L91_20050 [Anaerolineae bacterium]|nr:hypothetical protein [Anaerolineae bacterium]